MKLNAADKRLFEIMTSFPWDENGGPTFYEVIENPYRRDPPKFGIARRAIYDDPAELVRFACLGVRESWRNYLSNPSSEASSLWHTGLWALAINDTTAVDRILLEAPTPKMGADSPYPSYYGAFSDLFFGITTSDDSRARVAAGTLARRKLPTNDKVTAACLTAILDAEPNAFAESLDAVCDSVRKIRAIDPQYKFIDAIAHGLWALAFRRSPRIVNLWNVSHALPWDAELHRWCQAHADALDAIDASRLSENAKAALEMPPSPRGM